MTSVTAKNSINAFIVQDDPAVDHQLPSKIYRKFF